ncbi:MAG: hypothetical protein AB8G77_10255 [Rhodothermales bacterium]
MYHDFTREGYSTKALVASSSKRRAGVVGTTKTPSASVTRAISFSRSDFCWDESFSAKTLIDLGVSAEILPGVILHAGANNIFNTFPDRHQKAANYSSGRFPYSRRVTQFGTNGGFYYARLKLSL